jgi:hypothetical protein
MKFAALFTTCLGSAFRALWSARACARFLTEGVPNWVLVVCRQGQAHEPGNSRAQVDGAPLRKRQQAAALQDLSNHALRFLAILAAAWGLLAHAQEPPQPEQAPPTNELRQADELDQAAESTASEELPPTDESNGPASTRLRHDKPLLHTNAVPAAPAPNGGARRLESERQNRNQAAAQPAPASETSAGQAANAVTGPASLQYSAFRLITERNIFDPNRMPHTPSGPRPAPKVVESFALVGTMSYGKGDFAFFDGTSSEYKKVLKASDSIAGYRIVAIEPDSVRLARDTNQMVLAVGNQMRRQEGGPWVQAAGTGESAASSGGASNSASAGSSSGSSTSDILKRLMERRREQE